MVIVKLAYELLALRRSTFNCQLQLHEDAGVYHAACQVVGDGVLMVRDVRYPVVTADVVEAEDVEAVQA